MRAEPLTRALRGRWQGGYGTARCPAHNDREPSLSIKDGDDGRLLLFCHAGCEFRDVLEAIRGICQGIDLRPREMFGRGKTVGSRRVLADLISMIWSQAVAILGTPAERYLRSRSIHGDLPATLRFHGRLRHPSGAHLPAMVARVDHVRAGFVALHRTYVDGITSNKTSLKPDKAMLGPCKGGAVRLRGGSIGLAVCEGIETGLSLASGLDDGIALWAGLSTSGIAALELPSRHEFGGRLLIATDGDAPGRCAGACLGDRAALLGWTVDTVSAPDGFDFNDLARGDCNG